ncbi:hypothetical protein BGZ65_001804 [Modicella reniformis]|uniref:Uncharacterized protein n=1 Tax=Modicella reniformis TaxID=1440133 RepID=A0A9P6ILD7_9FUNG|nr:hypothetical protein BGZ65_001804 [Modicella reniformis]
MIGTVIEIETVTTTMTDVARARDPAVLTMINATLGKAAVVETIAIETAVGIEAIVTVAIVIAVTTAIVAAACRVAKGVDVEAVVNAAPGAIVKEIGLIGITIGQIEIAQSGALGP